MQESKTTEEIYLTPPAFLKRTKETPMNKQEFRNGKHPSEPNMMNPDSPIEEITLEMILEQIKKLSAKRDEIQATLTGLKKQARKMVGSL